MAPMLALAFLQALSHVREPLPPRVSRSPHWTPLATYVGSASARERVRRVGHVEGQAVFGTFDEWIASPRLLPVLVPRAEQRDAWKAVSGRAVASANPAIDYVGIGGGTPLRALA
jgi:hypothetical protein